MIATRRRWLAVAAWLASAAYLGLIWNLSSSSVQFVLVDDVPMRDKGVHFVEYGVLACMVVAALRESVSAHRVRIALAAVWLCVCAGVVDELHQAFVFGRSGELPDLGADALGALCVAALYVLGGAVRHRARA